MQIIRRACTTSVLGLVIGLQGCANQAAINPGGGVDEGATSALRNIVPAEQLEQSSAQQYATVIQEGQAKGALAKDSDPQVKRLRAIAQRIIPHAKRFNARAGSWSWEINLIRSNDINAFCMPGGKIAFYTGLIDTIKPSDDELAVVMGHEIAHALREHAREEIAKAGITNAGTEALATATGGTAGTLVKSGAGLLTLKFSRDHETDADLVGLELSARAGYDPNAGVTLWQKMAAASKGAPSEWFSTHPSGETRIATMRKNIPAVLPLYKAATTASTAAPKG